MKAFRPVRALGYAALLGWSAVCLVPLYWVTISSLKAEDDIVHGPRYVPFIDFQPNLDAWRFILFDSSENLFRPLWNSFFSSGVATALSTGAACLMLYAVTRGPHVAHQRWLLLATLATRVLLPMVVVLPLYLMFNRFGLLDTGIPLALTYAAMNLPVALWLLLPAFGAKASEQEESAMLDGASNIRIIWEILLPMLARSLFAVMLVVFVLCWNEYLFAAYLTTGQSETLTPWMVGQISIKEAQVGSEAEEIAHLSAATVLMAAPLLLFSSLVLRMLSSAVVPK